MNDIRLQRSIIILYYAGLCQLQDFMGSSEITLWIMAVILTSGCREIWTTIRWHKDRILWLGKLYNYISAGGATSKHMRYNTHSRIMYDRSCLLQVNRLHCVGCIKPIYNSHTFYVWFTHNKFKCKLKNKSFWKERTYYMRPFHPLFHGLSPIDCLLWFQTMRFVCTGTLCQPQPLCSLCARITFHAINSQKSICTNTLGRNIQCVWKI